MNEIPPPPPGFVVRQTLPALPVPDNTGKIQGAQIPPPPPGFQIEQPDNSDLMATLSARSRVFAGPTARGRYNAALQRVRESQFPDMSDGQWENYSARMFSPNVLSQSQQVGTFGLSDEISAGVGGVGAQLRQMTGGGGGGYGEAYGDLYELEQSRLELARQENGARGAVVEGMTGLAALGPGKGMATAPTMAGKFLQGAKAVPATLGAGAAYGFNATDGDFGARTDGALAGAAISAAGMAAAPLIAGAVRGGANALSRMPVNAANRRAATQAIKNSPTSAGIKSASQASYKASEATGATIKPHAMENLLTGLGASLRREGLVGPSGKLATGAFPKVANAMRVVREYAAGPISMEQAQVVLRALRTTQKSTDPAEARIGNLMVNQFEDFLDALPSSAFGNANVVRGALAQKAGQNPGAEAIKHWAKARNDWARSKKTQTIENIISDASLQPGRFAERMRSGFESILKSGNAKKRRGFTDDELDAIRRFVAGGPVDDLLQRLGSGAGLPGGLMGGVTGGLAGAVALPVVGGLAKGAANNQARRAADLIRAQVATPGGIPMRPQPPRLPAPPMTAAGGLTANAALPDLRKSMVGGGRR